MRKLHHLTIDTGHLAVTPRSDVSDEAIAWLQPIVDDEQGLADVLWFDLIRLMGPERRPKGAAACTIHLGHGGPALVQCVICWRSEDAETAWTALSIPEIAPVTGRRLSVPSLPWLATKLLPGIESAPQEVVAMLGDAQRCIAWTIIETPV